MSSELENIILTIDTHEEANKKEKTRQKAIIDWAQQYGVCSIEFAELPLCDYSLVGEFREKEINLGLEFKAWDNFLSDPIEDMEDKLTRSSELYKDVAFFVETGNYTFKPDQGIHCTLEYSDMAKSAFRKKGVTEPPTKTLAGMEGFFDTLSANGVHCRQLRSEAHFPFALHNLLIYLTKPHQLKLKVVNPEMSILDFYMRLPDIGFVRAKELLKNYPNPAWLCSASEQSLQEVIGKRIGKAAYEVLHCHDFETEAWRNGYHKDGTPKDTVQNDNVVPSSPPPAVQMGKPITPNKPLSPEAKKYQDFKRAKAGFKGGPAIPSHASEGFSKIITPLPQPPKADTSGSIPDVQITKDISIGKAKVSQSQSTKENAVCEPLTSCSTPDTSSHTGATIPPVPDLQAAPLNMREQVTTNPLKPVEVEGSFSAPPTPKYTNIDGYLREWFDKSHSMEETITYFYPQYSKAYTYDAVCRMTNDGALRRYSDKGTMRWTMALKAQPEMDIGV